MVWFVVFLGGPTDLFPHAAFVDEDKAMKWALDNRHTNCGGYIVKKMSSVELAELTDY